ncbi:AP2 ERF domain-containing transcription factor [Musa troglodytarum]|uniref:AP2 ERF domain-containing transcription factor n=1 Tax=Musa troglodytarum TaxID=320322 RepID=A0A9E7EXM2_9LILI|nr:AP2 ERF domain-containing transcription factor [Musa troglodytarum]
MQPLDHMLHVDLARAGPVADAEGRAEEVPGDATPGVPRGEGAQRRPVGVRGARAPEEGSHLAGDVPDAGDGRQGARRGRHRPPGQLGPAQLPRLRLGAAPSEVGRPG